MDNIEKIIYNLGHTGIPESMMIRIMPGCREEIERLKKSGIITKIKNELYHEKFAKDIVCRTCNSIDDLCVVV